MTKGRREPNCRPDGRIVGQVRKNMTIARLITGVALALAAGAALAQDAVPYCGDLKRVASLASARDRFASLAGKPREGNFSDTILPLAGWKDCSLYGAGMYTCDSPALPTKVEAEKVQAKATDEILSCFAGSWLEIKDRSSPGYVVLHPARGPASITLSIDEADSKEFIVRMTLFVRGS
jgi:hypothetical protein